MKVTKTAEGWEIIPQTSDEQSRLEWLIESVASHPDQQPRETGSGISNMIATGARVNRVDWLTFQRMFEATGGVGGYLQLKQSDPEMLQQLLASFHIEIPNDAIPDLAN